jgi:hypothetical protein
LAPREAHTTSDDAIAIAPPAPTPDVTTHATQALVRLRSPEEQFNTELFSAPVKQHLPRNYALQHEAIHTGRSRLMGHSNISSTDHVMSKPTVSTLPYAHLTTALTHSTRTQRPDVTEKLQDRELAAANP